MSDYFYKALYSFRGVFSRRRTWIVFCMLVCGFVAADELIGISSFCRFWGLGERGYHTFLHFFRSSAWSAGGLVFSRTAFVLSQNLTVTAQGRAVTHGDHTYVPKDGRRMPGVVTLYQESGTQSRPSSYFRGHQWGALGLLIGSLAAPFCIPLSLALHRGFVHIGEGDGTEEDRETLGTRMIRMAISFAVTHNLPCVLVPDAYFPCAAVFGLAASVWSAELRQPMVTLIIRAKKNCVAYFPAEKTEGKRPAGRPREYGEKVKLAELFDHSDLFGSAECRIYGKVEDISVTALRLLWKPAGSLILFVLAVTSRGPIILMCSDLNQDPLLALELYCSGRRAEGMSDMLKNLIGAFRYRFWSKLMPRHSRRPKKNENLREPTSENTPAVRLCREAYERFAMIGAISPGLLQLIALRFGDSVRSHFSLFLRSRSRELPSERTVKHVISRMLIADFLSFAPGGIMREIRRLFFGEKYLPQRASPTDEPESRGAAN